MSRAGGPRPPISSAIPSALVVGAALGAAYLGAAWRRRPEPPRVVEFRKQAVEDGRKARLWAHYARLSDEGVTTIVAGGVQDYSTGRLRYTPGEILEFNHFVPRPRPKDPLEAQAFDRAREAAAAKCRLMEAYYDALRIKWERAARRWSNDVPADPPPPLRLEPSSVQDMTS